MLKSSNINNLVKVSLIGYPAVGKTTISKLLSQNITNTAMDRIYLPTQGFDLKTIQYNNINFKLWDFGGQRAYINYLEDYIVGSDLVFIVTDSTLNNVINSKKLLEMAWNIIDDDCPIVALANKQDLCRKDGRMEKKVVEQILKIKTYGLTAIESSERTKLLNIVRNELKEVLIRRGLKENEISRE